jgi:NAD(P)-dependent dehydrogenase (short-subunit alcohol dehydrogenase family)
LTSQNKNSHVVEYVAMRMPGESCTASPPLGQHAYRPPSREKGLRMTRQIVVSGGASGIGAAVVDMFAREGSQVAVLDRTQPQAAQVHAGVSWLPCDLTNPAAIDEAVDQIDGDVDVLCNIAGVSGVAPVGTVIAVNFAAVRHLTDRLAPRIVSGGAVVNLASTAGWRWRDALPALGELVRTDTWEATIAWAEKNLPTGYDAYERSKQAVIVWTSVAAQQYLGRFRVNSVSPGPVETPLLADFYESMGHEELDPLTARGGGRNGTPDEIARVVRFLTVPDSSWINGTDVVVDAGAEMAEMLASEGILAAALPGKGHSCVPRQ